MKTVHEVSDISGVSIRTLHHYDAIGLLKPAALTPAGYRLYDDNALHRLQEILLFRELEFPLKDIAALLDNPDYNRSQALSDQIHLLELRQKHVTALLESARSLQKNGGVIMDFSAFDNTEYRNYAAEAKERWSGTDAYREYEKKVATLSEKKQQASMDELMSKFIRFGELKDGDPAAPEAGALVRELQQFITDNYYTCTNAILSGLGQMYTDDDRMKNNIDHAGGEGTAAFAAEAIRLYCAE